MMTQNKTAVPFQITTLSIFGDRENGRASEPGRCRVNGVEFISKMPESRREAAFINSSLTGLRIRLERSQK
jgi:hypothetical protein